MATLTKGKTFANGELVTPQKLHELVDLGTVSGIVNADVSNSAAIALSKLAPGALPTGITVASANIVDGSIVNADISASAAIADTKLAQITTANKVAQSAVTNLTTDLAGKAAASHTHDDRYYTETEVSTLLAGKAPATGIAPSAIAGTAVITTDSRLSDSRPPTSHTHGNITNAGAIGATANLSVVTTTSGILTTIPAGSAGQVLTSNGGASAPSFQTLAATSTNASNLTGGSAGTVPYQSAAGTTAMLAAGTSGQVLRSNGAAAPSWLTLAASATTDATNAANISAGTLPLARIPTGTTATSVCIGNDPRLSDARTPTAHNHDASNISSGTLANVRTTATSANTASAIVARDASGNFSAGSITASAVNSSFGAIRIGRGSGNDATNTALGGGAPLSSITNGLNNTAIGYDSQKLTTTGNRNVSVGQESLYNNTTGSSNVAIGTAAGNRNSGSLNTAIGDSAAYNNTGVGNTALGAYSLNAHTTANNSTAIGYSAGSTGNFTNATSLGYTADVTANNQVQLGNSSTTTFAYGAVQNRSDKRDKTDMRPTILGLDFIKAIEPVDYKWDFREDYRPAPPQTPGLTATQAELDEYAAAQAKYLEDIKFSNLTADGTHKRTRYHHGVIAQQVQQVIKASGVDFGGFQDHKISGGDDVLSIGYLEFIAPLIKAVQELAARVEVLETR